MLQSSGLVFGDVVLDRSCLFAHRDGKQIRFTRSERALLLMLSGKPNSLLRRSQLLDAIASTDSDISDRNVDFLINRLRSKLGDSARSPRYIATQYGEGYVWIAEPLPVAAPTQDLAPANGLLAIIPNQDTRWAEQADAVTQAMCKRIASGVGQTQTVIVARREEDVATQYLLTMNFQPGVVGAICTATLREAQSRRILRAMRIGPDSSGAVDIERASEDVIEALQRNLAEASEGLGTPADQPLEIRFRRATTLLSASNPQWLEKGLQLRAAREQNPGSADIALQWCMHLFARLVLTPPFIGIGRSERNDLESEIEETVLECLPLIESNPLLMLAAAKLLYFVDRGHLDLAEDLADRAFARTADFATALPVLGQLRQARGDFAAAVAFFDRGIEMTEAGSQFETHMRVLKCIALLAAGDRQALDALASSYQSPHSPPDLVVMVAAMVTPAGRPLPPAAKKVLVAAGPEGARNAIEYTYMTSVRHLTSVQARANIMRGLLAHLAGLHGQDVSPPFVLAGLGMTAPA